MSSLSIPQTPYRGSASPGLEPYSSEIFSLPMSKSYNELNDRTPSPHPVAQVKPNENQKDNANDETATSKSKCESIASYIYAIAADLFIEGAFIALAVASVPLLPAITVPILLGAGAVVGAFAGLGQLMYDNLYMNNLNSRASSFEASATSVKIIKAILWPTVLPLAGLLAWTVVRNVPLLQFTTLFVATGLLSYGLVSLASHGIKQLCVDAPQKKEGTQRELDFNK